MNKPDKISYDYLIKTTSAFFVDDDYETEVENSVNEKVKLLRDSMLRIDTKKGLTEYILKEKDSLENIIYVINISSEKFKRIITKLRIDKGMSITGEWDLNKIRTMMIDKPDFMNEICDLLMNGSQLDQYSKLIPSFYRKNFTINEDTIARLVNRDELTRLVKKGVEGKYTNGIGDRVFSTVAKRVNEICELEGLSISTKKNVELLGKMFSIIIPNESDPKILIDFSFNITTSSGQTKYKEIALATARKLKSIRDNGGSDILFINIIDGAGWVARQSDMKDIYRYSDYMVNLNNLDTIKDIVAFHMNK